MENKERFLVVEQNGDYFKVQTPWSNEELETTNIFKVISEHKTAKEALNKAKRGAREPIK